MYKVMVPFWMSSMITFYFRTRSSTIVPVSYRIFFIWHRYYTRSVKYPNIVQEHYPKAIETAHFAGWHACLTCTIPSYVYTYLMIDRATPTQAMQILYWVYSRNIHTTIEQLYTWNMDISCLIPSSSRLILVQHWLINLPELFKVG